jgi:hypothetical protein
MPIAKQSTQAGDGLAPLQWVDPGSLLSGDDAVDGFVLALALAHNDIKTIWWINKVLGEQKPDNNVDVSPRHGEWGGIRVQVARWLIGLTHEVIHAINVAHTEKVLSRRNVRAAVNSLPDPYARLWKELIAVSTKPSGATLRPYLRNLRNQGAFHFAYPTELLKGYRSFFLTDKRTNFNERAFVSIGPTLKQTRFYFADAAAQRMYTGDDDLESRFNQAIEFIRDLHHTLSGFVWAYVKQRARTSRQA